MICAIDFSNLHTILRSLYDEMMPLCEDMSGVAQGIAGLGAFVLCGLPHLAGVGTGGAD